MREEFGQFGAEQGAVERPHAADHGAHAQCDPQRAEHGAAVTQHDVKPGQRQPDVGAAGALPPVSPRTSVEVGMCLAHTVARCVVSASTGVHG